MFGPSNYDECILESMKGVTSDKAAILIAMSCRKKFPEESETNRDVRALSNEELSRLTGRAAGPTVGNYFSGNLYNGNANITVSEITIWVTTTIDGEEVSRAYSTSVNIKPHSTEDFGFNIVVGDTDAMYKWGISGGKGY